MFDIARRRVTLLTIALTALAGCGGSGDAPAPAAAAGGTPPPAPPSPSASPSPSPAPSPAPPAVARSSKRGIAYDLADAHDFAALSPGVGWWYAWGSQPNSSAPSSPGMDFIPMLWNGSFDAVQVEAYLKSHTGIKYLLVLNEPNLVDQSNMTPQQAAALWSAYEAVSAHTGVKIVGPAMTWGTMAGYADPVVWLDAFYAAYRAAHAGRDPQVDYLAFHWYDYGLGAQLDRLLKYGKSVWVTEFANWHSQQDGAQIDTAAKQQAQMTDMVATCEARADVFRYAWFTGRWSNDTHHTSLLDAAPGALTDLGRLYLSLPFQ